jgi:hypothetical protein
MKMRIFRRKNIHTGISLIWLLGMLSSCSSYFHLNSSKQRIENELFSGMNDQNTVFFVHVKNQSYPIVGARVQKNQLEGNLETKYKSEENLYQKAREIRQQNPDLKKQQIEINKSKKEQQIQIDTIQGVNEHSLSDVQGSKEITHQVHLFSNDVSLKDNSLTLNLKDVFHMDVLKKSGDARHVFFVILIVIGSIFLLLTLIGIIVLIVSCNCPHVYLENGDEYAYTNTLFTGALSQELERFDNKLLPDFHPEKSTLKMEIRNEDKEIQFTNFLQLIAAYHDPSFQVLSDQNGTFYSIAKPEQAISAKDQNGISVQELLAELDGSTYSFDTPSKNGMASNFLSFHGTNSSNQGKLVLSLRNSDWAGLIHQEFNQALGSHQEKWVTNNRKQNGEKQAKQLKNAGIPLVVYIKKNHKWLELETIQPIGNAANQTLIIPIEKKYLDKNAIEIRIDGGFRFWELDYAAMDFSSPKPFELQRISPTSVSGDPRFLNALQQDDENYMKTSIGSEAISVQFEGLKPVNRTLFVRSKGYYIRQEMEQGKPAWLQLAKMKRPNGIARFSQDVFFKYIHPFEQLSVR